MSLTEIKDVMILDRQTRLLPENYTRSVPERLWRSYFVCWALHD